MIKYELGPLNIRNFNISNSKKLKAVNFISLKLDIHISLNNRSVIKKIEIGRDNGSFSTQDVVIAHTQCTVGLLLGGKGREPKSFRFKVALPCFQ